jgi:hypothetical protein
VSTGTHHTNQRAELATAGKLLENPSFLVAVAGAWLVAAPLLLDHRSAGTAFAVWNDVLVGAALLVFAVIRIVRPAGTAVLSLVSSGAGVWLIAAPFVGQYTGALHATLNDMIVGLLVVMIAGIGWTVGRAPRR